jgi:multiple sugar transport system permease protein
LWLALMIAGPRLFANPPADPPAPRPSLAPPPRVRVSVQHYDPYSPHQSFVNLVCRRLMREDATLEVTPYRQLGIQGGPGGEAARYMAHAAGLAPDVTTWLVFHDMRAYIRQGFYLPLNEFIGEDRDGNGFVDDAESVWPEWRRIPEFYRRVATVDGKVYGVPNLEMGMACLLFRRDLLRDEGLDPDRMPEDFGALYRVLQRLTRPRLVVPGARSQRGRYGMAIEPHGWQFCPWVWAAGGHVVMQERTNPRTGRTHAFALEELAFRDPETGEDLSRQPTRWTATFGGEGGQRALEFYRRLRWSRWTREPATDAPVDLSAAEAAAGRAVLPDGREWRFAPADVVTGVCRVNWGADAASAGELLRRGEVAMVFMVCDAPSLARLDIPPENLGLWPVPPAVAGGAPAMMAQHHYRALSATLAGDANLERRAKAWSILAAMNGERGARWQAEYHVRAGLAHFLDPVVLRRFGMEEHLDFVPPNWRADWERALRYARTEPYEGFWPPVKTQLLGNEVLSLALTMEGFDGRGALATAERKANDGLMYPRTEERMRRYRPWGWGGLAVLAIALTALGVAMLRALRDRAAETAAPAQAAVRIGSRRIAWTPLLLLAPALALIAMWKYYPLLRGGLMAFQDYRLSGESRWVGADNFIAVFLDPGFWVSVRQTFKFVLLSLALGFVTPVFLALLLTEVPRLKILFRTLFFLPQVSSGLVILFLWKLFYNPTPDGLLNRLLGLSPPVDWLGDPRWTMLAVILPGVWAGAGMGSLIYQAALRTIPPDLYEAAAVDGAGVFRNLRHITLPQLAPLLVINFVGVFIGTFHAMGNIFALTAGGPGNETMVLSLAIWYEAFAFLRFGTATAMAWVLGSILVGFTLMQLRLLRRVEFRRTEEA